MSSTVRCLGSPPLGDLVPGAWPHVYWSVRKRVLPSFFSGVFTFVPYTFVAHHWSLSQWNPQSFKVCFFCCKNQLNTTNCELQASRWVHRPWLSLASAFLSCSLIVLRNWLENHGKNLAVIRRGCFTCFSYQFLITMSWYELYGRPPRVHTFFLHSFMEVTPGIELIRL